MSRVVAALCLFACISLTPAHGRNWPAGTSVRIATEGAYKPWNFSRRDGKLAGFEIDLVRMLCADLRFDCPIRRERWGAIIGSLESGKFDAVFAGMSITAPRRTRVAFTTPYASTPAVFVTATDRQMKGADGRHLTLPDVDPAEQRTVVALRQAFLSGFVGVQKGTTHEIFLRDYMTGYFRIRTYRDQDSLDAAVASGKLAAMLVGLGYAVPLTKRAGKHHFRIVGPQISGGPFGEGIGAAVRRADTNLAHAFSAAIEKRIADGSISKLSRKWFGFDVSARP